MKKRFGKRRVLDELEPLASRVLLLQSGKAALSADVNELRSRFRRLTLDTPSALDLEQSFVFLIKRGKEARPG